MAVLDSLSEGVLALAADGSIVAANPSAESMLQFRIRDLRAAHWSQLRWHVTDEQGTPLVEEHHPVAATLADGRARRDQLVGLLRGGTVARWLNVDTHILADEFRGPGGIVVSFGDVTGRIRAEHQLRDQARRLADLNAELQRADAVKRDFMSMTSHELRTPIVSLLGYGELLQQGWDRAEESEQREYIAAMVRQGRHLLRLVDDLLVASRLESGAVQPQREVVNVAQLVDAALDGLTGWPRVDVDVPAEASALVDPDHGRRILVNLVENALKYGSLPVSVEARLKGDRVSIAVADRGEGVSEQFVPHLFERFSQASTGRARAARGTGLGLAIVAGLAALNGGDVHYEPNQPWGARFVVHLPAAPAS